jgi:heavy metal sensor kinase
MPSARAKASLRTLRFRLTLWNTAVLAGLLLVCLLAVRQGLHSTLMRMVDEFLDEELAAATREVHRRAPDWEAVHGLLDRRAAGHPRRGLFVQVFTEDGQYLWGSTHTPPLDRAPRPDGEENAFRTRGGYRYVHGHVTTGRVRKLVVQVGCSLRRADQDLERYTYRLIGIGGLGLLLAPLGGFLLAARATRPVGDIIITAARLQPDRLDERLPVRGTHDELDQLSVTINGLLDRIARYLEQTRGFTANAAHELRSPLTALYSSLEVALNAERSVAEYQEILADLLEEASGLRLLVNRLLLLAEGDAGQLCKDPQPVRLDDVVRRSAEMFQGVAETAGVELEVGRLEPLVVPGDAGHLWQVINNLLDNATKFTPAPGRIRVTLAQETSGTAVLRVADSGSGIAAEDLPRVFERFYRGDKGRGRQGRARGTGLGLNICQTIVAAHRGTISIASTLGRGTEVTVRLPGCTRAGPARGPSPGAQKKLSSA